MATIGQQLTAPETGWKRYDDRSPQFKYLGTWSEISNASATGGYYKDTIDQSAEISFKFIGTKIRLIGVGFSSGSTNIKIDIDGVIETFSCYSAIQINSMLLYEKTGLSNTEHVVKIYTDTSNNKLRFDAIDIDSTGRLLHPDEVLDPKDLNIGKRIRCHYQAFTSGQVGVFSGLGQETSDFIPPASSATPNGDFYWICCDIKNGKKILLADRNIQHSISWDKINEQGMTNTGREITF
jgi:hypothetical protein